MTDLVEELARALAKQKGIEICSDAQYAHSSFRGAVDAILPIIRRREIEAAEKMQEECAESVEFSVNAGTADHCIRSLDPVTIIGR